MKYVKRDAVVTAEQFDTVKAKDGIVPAGVEYQTTEDGGGYYYIYWYGMRVTVNHGDWILTSIKEPYYRHVLSPVKFSEIYEKADE